MRWRLALLAGAVALTAALVSIVRGAHGDLDPRVVYDPEGHALLHGTYPHSPYPAGAVALFALEALLGGSAHNVDGLLMVPFQMAAVAALAERRSIAVALAVWPANVFFWQFRFDLVPAAAIAVGIALARHRRWHAAGWVFGVGAAVKWTPALAALGVIAWLLTRGEVRAAVRHTAGAAAALLLTQAPVFALAFDAAVAPYRAQTARGITGESLPYLPLRLLGLARPPHRFYGESVVPRWAPTVAAAMQLGAVAAVVALAARAPGVETAALVPAAFLLTNRIFSPQFFVVILVCCACAMRARATVPALLLAVATAANAILYPGLAGAQTATWTAVSALALLPAVAAVAVLAR